MMNKYTRNLFKKVASVALAGAMTLSMAMPVAAANDDPNLVVEANTKYSTPIKAGSKVTLGLMPANEYYQRTGFDSELDATNGLEVTGVTVGEDKLTGLYTYGFMATTDYDGDATWAGTVEVQGADDKYGPASLHIVNKNNKNAGIDMTVYVEAAETQKPVEVSKVTAVDVSGTGIVNVTTNNLSVAAATTKTSNPFNGAEGSAQSYPTAGDALYSLVEANNMSFTQNGGYVQSVTNSNGKKLEAYTTEDWTYYGWNYCVIRNGAKVAEGDIVSASVLEVEKGDSVYWAFGTMNQANAYFKTIK